MTALRLLLAALLLARPGPWSAAADLPAGGFVPASGGDGRTAVAPALAPGAGPPEDPKTYRIQPGDIVSIVVFPVSEYSREVTVQPDGMIELPLLGALTARDLTPLQLRSLLEDRYKRFVADPKVTVNVRRFAGRRVAIIGESRAAGLYEYRDGMRLLDLVTQASGLTDLAKPSRAVILRQDPKQGLIRIKVNLARVLQGDASRNLALAPGDTVVIPKGKLTRSTQWVNTNILPWLGLASLVASLVLISR